jgi:hypothetical protein
MRVHKRSAISGIVHEMDLDITLEQIERYNKGELIQNVFTNLSADEREFLMTGITAKEWDDLFGEKSLTVSTG